MLQLQVLVGDLASLVFSLVQTVDLVQDVAHLNCIDWYLRVLQVHKRGAQSFVLL